MAVYLYNLMFSLNGANVNVGSFEPYPSSLPSGPNINNVSSAWFTASASPPGFATILSGAGTTAECGSMGKSAK